MRLRIVHDVNFAFDKPAQAMIALVRLTPRSEAGVFVHDWRIDVSSDVPVQRFQDAFGNVTHTFSLEGPIEEASVTATGTVETEDTNGVVGATGGRVPPEVFLRPTPITALSTGVRALADRVRAASSGSDPLDFAHRLNAVMMEDFASVDENERDDGRTTEETLGEKGGTSTDLAHLFVAACRAADVPSRFVSG